MSGTLAPGHRRVFRAVAECAVPRARAFDEDAWRRALEIVETALADRPPTMRRQLRLFLRLVEWLPVLRWGRRFQGLEADRQTRLLRGLQDAPLLLLRRGVWGLRTLAFMGCYGLSEVRREIGYRAHPRGWAARRVREGDGEPDVLEPGPEIQL